MSLWFPLLSAERVVREYAELARLPVAVVDDRRGRLLIASASPVAARAGLREGMSLGDARSIVPGLVTFPADPEGDTAFLDALRRWAGQFSPWTTEVEASGLLLDVTGCAHLFGGEEALMLDVTRSVAALGLSLRFGLADTVGAAWAVAHFGEASPEFCHSGDAIDQEARATRSRARKRKWERGGDAPFIREDHQAIGQIIPRGEAAIYLAGLPVAALRLDGEQVERLNALGLRRIGDLATVPRAQLSRRVGTDVLRRLDQALGDIAEPVSPARPDPVLALRLTFPEPIGLQSDVRAGIDRLLEPLCKRLSIARMGARQVRLTLTRVDGRTETHEIGLARPSDRPRDISELLGLRLGDIDAGFGIERIRLEASLVEPIIPRQHRGQFAVTSEVRRKQSEEPEGITDLLGRIGARLGLEALTRLHPADSHIPEKSVTVMAAAYTEPALDWPMPVNQRPILIFPPEPITPGERGIPPESFVWRRQALLRAVAHGPERIAPEWWLDDPAWRSGARDYWRVETTDGTRLWIYEVTVGKGPTEWFAHGMFA